MTRGGCATVCSEGREDDVHELIYRSQATGPFDRAEIQRILATSRRENLVHAVTGLLLYSDHSFLQVLEGEAADVHETFARIAVDPRHHDVEMLVDGPIEQRRYASWTMGFHHLDGDLVAPGETLDLERARAVLALHAPRAAG